MTGAMCVPDESTCREAAGECLRIANKTKNQDVRMQFVVLAGKFLDLATLGGGDVAFRALLDEYNGYQMQMQM